MSASRKFNWGLWLTLIALAGGGFYGYHQWKSKSAARATAAPDFRTNKVS